MLFMAEACPEKLVGEAQSNFPTRDHQNIFNLILIRSYMYSDGKYLRGPTAMLLIVIWRRAYYTGAFKQRERYPAAAITGNTFSDYSKSYFICTTLQTG